MTLCRAVCVRGAKRRGLTLIELVVVISVIGILLGFVMPALKHARYRTQQVVCQGQLHDLGLGFSIYCSDHEGRFMAASGGADGGWVDVLASKGSDDAVMCPSTSRTEPGGEEAVPGPGGRSEAWTLGGDDGRLIRGSYGVNGWVYEDNEGAKGLAWGSSLAAGGNNVPVLLDAMWVAGKFREGDRPPAYEGEVPRDSQNEARPPDSLYFCIDRHGGCVNGLFMDWSVRPVGLKQLWRLKWHRQFDTAGPWAAGSGRSPQWPHWMRDMPD